MIASTFFMAWCSVGLLSMWRVTCDHKMNGKNFAEHMTEGMPCSPEAVFIISVAFFALAGPLLLLMDMVLVWPLTITARWTKMRLRRKYERELHIARKGLVALFTESGIENPEEAADAAMVHCREVLHLRMEEAWGEERVRIAKKFGVEELL